MVEVAGVVDLAHPHRSRAFRATSFRAVGGDAAPGAPRWLNGPPSLTAVTHRQLGLNVIDARPADTFKP